jgi:transposase-like protein
MDTKLKDILNNIQQLNHSERELLKKYLHDITDSDKIIDLIESRQDNNHHCPYCNKEKIYKHGKSAKLQRYKCLNCGKTFNALTGTPLARLRKKDLWLRYMDCMLDSMTLRKISSKLPIHLKTAFLWRHRFTQELGKDTPNSLDGIVEADETYFRQSRKGCRKLTRKPRRRGRDGIKRGLSKEQVCVLAVIDRSKNEIAMITGLGAVKGKSLERHLQGRIASDAVLVTDGLKSYNYFCSKNNLTHEVVKNEKGKRTSGSYHIQNVNSYHSRLKNWISITFHGVATKYLNHYLWWRHELDNKNMTDSVGLMKLALGIPQLNGT